MSKNITFLLGCLLGTEEGNSKVLPPYAACMELWNLALDEETRSDVEETVEVIPTLVDLLNKGNAGEATTPCIGCLEALSRSDQDETKAAIQRGVGTFVGRFETYAQDHSDSETQAIYGVLSNLVRGRRSAAVMIADRMLKPSTLKGLQNWVDKDVQASAVNFMAALSTCHELHEDLLAHLSMDLALKIMLQKTNKRAAHPALEYLGELAKTEQYTQQVHELLSTKGLPGMEWLAKNGNPRNRAKVAEIMWGMVKVPSKVKLFRRTIPSLAPLLTSDDMGIIETVTATLWFMTYDDIVCMSLGSGGAVVPLVKHVSSKSDKIRLQTTGILRNMAQHDTLLRMISDAGCPPHLVKLWKPIKVTVELPGSNPKPKFPAISLNML